VTAVTGVGRHNRGAVTAQGLANKEVVSFCDVVTANPTEETTIETINDHLVCGVGSFAYVAILLKQCHTVTLYYKALSNKGLRCDGSSRTPSRRRHSRHTGQADTHPSPSNPRRLTANVHTWRPPSIRTGRVGSASAAKGSPLWSSSWRRTNVYGRVRALPSSRVSRRPPGTADALCGPRRRRKGHRERRTWCRREGIAKPDQFR
jgi:hypothetical protein